jgi:DNA-binding SARP family transcriptional activator
VEYRILGPVELAADGVVIPLGPKLRTLLAVLLLHPNHVVSATRLADELWGGEQPASAPKLVQLYVSQLRKLLGDALVTRAPGYLVAVAEDELDAARFERLVVEARSAASESAAVAASSFEAALSLWRGPALADVECAGFARNEADRLDALRVATLEEWFDVELGRGRASELVPDLQALVAAEPLRERPRAQLMLALHRSGRRADALEVYRQTRRLMVDELGLEPSEELRTLERTILEGDRGLRRQRGGTDSGLDGSEEAASAGAGPAPPSRPKRPMVLVAACALAVAAGAAAATFVASRGSHGLNGLAPNHVGLLDPRSGKIEAQVAVGDRPVALAAAAGQVWVANRDSKSVTRVDEKTAATMTIPLDGHPTAIAADAAGAWVEEGPERQLVRIARAFDRPTHSLPHDDSPLAIGGGALWASSDDGVVLEERDPRTGAIRRAWRPDLGAEQLAYAGATLWTAASFSTTPLETRSGVLLSPVRLVGTAVAVGAAPGEAWVVVRSSLGGPWRVQRIDRQSLAATGAATVGSNPEAVAVAGDAAWIANSSDGTVTRIVRATMEIKTIPVGATPTALVASSRGIWVAVAPA